MSAAGPAVKSVVAQPMALAFQVTVSAVQELSPTFRRVTLGGYSLRDFGVSGETLDLRIKLAIPSLDDAGNRLPLPVFDLGNTGWYREWLALDPATRGALRTYTVRNARLDAVYPEIDVDFVMHFPDGQDSPDAGGSPGAKWALSARPGDAVTIIGPNNRAAHCVTAGIYSGIEWRPGLAQRVLLAGDETAVPAISAILESLPADVSGHAILEVPDAGDFLDLSSKADLEITWLARGAATGRPRSHGELLAEAVRRVIPVPGWVGLKARESTAGPEPEGVDVDQEILWETPARLDSAAIERGKNPHKPAGALPFYAWVAGEAGVVKELRRYLVRDVGMDRKQVAFMGYWRKGKAEL
jgi:NADPH-dependent ferric siderophore reductase